LCVTTQPGVDVSTAHLATRTATGAIANDAQCAELAALLARRATARPVIFGGDVNRSRPCAPEHAWSRADTSAGQAPGLQGIYGTSPFGSPATHAIPATHTDHDALLVRAHVGP
jgi:hypothetical protein